MFLPFLSAILGILAFLPFDYFWLFGFIFLVPFFSFFIKKEKLWQLVIGTLFFRLLFYFGTVYFTLEPINWFLSILIFIGLPISIFIVKKILNFYQSRFLRHSLFITLPFLWTFFDHLTAYYSFLPTYIITSGNIFGSSPFLGLAEIGGLTLLTFFTALINVLIALAIINLKNRFHLSIGAIFAAIIIIVFTYAIANFQLQKNSSIYNNLNDSLNIAAISVNEKFNFTEFNQLKNELIGKKIDLLVFPEEIFGNIKESKQLNFYKNLAKELNINLIAAFDTIQNNKRYNSSVLFDNNGAITGIHNKNRLTFIGEWWPFGNWRPFFLNWLDKTDPNIKDYVIFNPKNFYWKGKRNVLSVNGKLFASIICLEANYPKDMKEYKTMGARFFVNHSSSRWIDIGIKHYIYLFSNLRKIEAVWLKIPIISAGIKDWAGIFLPNGKNYLTNYENNKKNYGLFFGKIKL